MAKYTVEAPDGKRVTFEWNDTSPPTDADMEEVFAAAETASPKKYKYGMQKIADQVLGREVSDSPKEEFRKSLQSMVPTSEGAGPMSGALIGAHYGKVAGPYGAAIGGVLGMLGGEYAERAARGKGTTPAQVPEDVYNAIKAEAVGQGAGAVVRSIGRGIGRLPGLRGKEITPEIAQRLKAAQEFEGEVGEHVMTPADVTGKFKPAAIETQLNKSLVTADIAQEAHARKISALGKYAEKVLEKIGPSITKTQAGEAIQTATKTHRKQFMAAAEKLYNEIPVKPEAIVETNAFRETALSMSDELGKLKNPTIQKIMGAAEAGTKYETSKLVNAQGKPFPPVKTPTYTWEQIRADQSAIKKLINRTADFNTKRMLYQLSDAINEDIAKFADTVAEPEIKTLLQSANKFYRYGDDLYAGIQDFSDKNIKQMLKTSNPDEIFSQIFKPKRENITLINRVKRVAGAGFKDMKSSFVSNMMSQGKNGEFSPLAFNKTWKAYPDEVKRTIFSPEEYEGLKKLSQLSEMSGVSESLAGNPSGSGVFGGNFWTIVQIFKHPVLMAAGGLTGKGFANFYFNNPEARRLFVNGLKFPPNSGQATAAAAKLTAILNQKMSEEKQD